MDPMNCQTKSDSHCAYVTKRCDELVNNNLKPTVPFNNLDKMYKTSKKIFFILISVNMALTCAVPALMIITQLDQHDQQTGPETRPDLVSAPSNDNNICFNCTELENIHHLSGYSVNEVFIKGDSCCLESIPTFYMLVEKTFQKQVDAVGKQLEQSVNSIYKEFMLRRFNAENSSQTAHIERILQWITPKRKIMVNLASSEGTPVKEDKTMSGRFYKVKWNGRSNKTLNSDEIRLKNGGLNIEVLSAAYYFLYTRLQFQSTVPNNYGGADKFCLAHGLRQLTRDTRSDVIYLQT